MWSTDRLRLGAALSAGAALLGACAGAPPVNGRVEHPLTPLDQYPVHAVRSDESVALAVHPGGALSPAQEAALADLARRWREAGGVDAVAVQNPDAAGPDGALAAQAAAARLAAFGVPAPALRLGPYAAGSAPGAPVLARFERVEAVAPDCDGGWGNLVSTNSNAVSTHFGCAEAHNFAVMLANPRDLLASRPLTPADAGRRAAVLDAYRKGAVTASAKDEQANGAISQAVR